MSKKALWITAGALAGAVVIGGSAVAVATAAEQTDVTSAPSASPFGTADDDLARAADAALAEVGAGRVLDVDRDDDASHAYEVDVLRDAGGIVEVRLDAAFGTVSVQGDDDRSPSASPVPAVPASPAPVAGGDAEKAAAAALAAVGQGRVSEVSRDDDDGIAWEVEIELPSGEDIDVELDAEFRVVDMG